MNNQNNTDRLFTESLLPALKPGARPRTQVLIGLSLESTSKVLQHIVSFTGAETFDGPIEITHLVVMEDGKLQPFRGFSQELLNTLVFEPSN
jgi:hypothetical protein